MIGGMPTHKMFTLFEAEDLNDCCRYCGMTRRHRDRDQCIADLRTVISYMNDSPLAGKPGGQQPRRAHRRIDVHAALSGRR